MKIKSATESCVMSKEHGYLGEHKNNLESGHTPHGKIPRHSQGSGPTAKDASAGDIPKDTNQKY